MDVPGDFSQMIHGVCMAQVNQSWVK